MLREGARNKKTLKCWEKEHEIRYSAVCCTTVHPSQRSACDSHTHTTRAVCRDTSTQKHGAVFVLNNLDCLWKCFWFSAVAVGVEVPRFPHLCILHYLQMLKEEYRLGERVLDGGIALKSLVLSGLNWLSILFRGQNASQVKNKDDTPWHRQKNVTV